MSEIVSAILGLIIGGIVVDWLLGTSAYKQRKQFHLIIKNQFKMSEQLDALKNSVTVLETQLDVNNALLGTLSAAVKTGAETAANLQTQLDAAKQELVNAGADTAALDAISVDLAAHTATLKSADDAATPAP